jgi:hypothetical protein
MANREYFVIDSDGFISCVTDGKSHDPDPEAFATLKEATKRAERLSRQEPGMTVVVARAVAYVTAPVMPPKVEIRKLK